jgi:hypothetical protein
VKVGEGTGMEETAGDGVPGGGSFPHSHIKRTRLLYILSLGPLLLPFTLLSA